MGVTSQNADIELRGVAQRLALELQRAEHAAAGAGVQRAASPGPGFRPASWPFSLHVRLSVCAPERSGMTAPEHSVGFLDENGAALLRSVSANAPVAQRFARRSAASACAAAADEVRDDLVTVHRQRDFPESSDETARTTTMVTTCGGPAADVQGCVRANQQRAQRQAIRRRSMPDHSGLFCATG